MAKSFEERNPDDDRWLLAEAKTKSGPLFIRLNTTAKEFVGDAALNVRLGFAIPLKKKTGHQLPDADENDALAAVEDEIRQTVAAGAKGIHVLTLTDPNVKELIFYIEPGTDIAAMHKSLMSSIKSHEVQCIAVRDPHWETYLEFLPD